VISPKYQTLKLIFSLLFSVNDSQILYHWFVWRLISIFQWICCHFKLKSIIYLCIKIIIYIYYVIIGRLTRVASQPNLSIVFTVHCFEFSFIWLIIRKNYLIPIFPIIVYLKPFSNSDQIVTNNELFLYSELLVILFNVIYNLSMNSFHVFINLLTIESSLKGSFIWKKTFSPKIWTNFEILNKISVGLNRWGDELSANSVGSHYLFLYII